MAIVGLIFAICLCQIQILFAIVDDSQMEEEILENKALKSDKEKKEE
uniref:Col_cuticle_N domain-containing protein n=1 Tax=Meloidogyne hapla TaxID=6305 RepID=A0A1I8C0M7_MELHA